ncbi:MAG: hypothetical protein WC729_18245 [Sphingomonas sp.]|jgi:hypothetical protein|uniref:hypothetical protein n=1 Tax=Sphingomonas sp. TaxID=28214 RepID=UPI003564F5B2
MKRDCQSEPRRMSAFLLAGMLLLPTVSVWFFLRRGYASSLRRIAFIYAGTLFAIGLVGAVFR